MRAKWIALEVFLAAGVLLTWYFIVHSKSYPQVEMLRWLDAAEATETFQDDIATDRLRFFVVNGITAAIPGVGQTNYERCYKEVRLENIKGTSDKFVNDEHFRLNTRARDFAASYNLLMREYIDRQKGRDCDIQ
ncbi:hypothetical protein [Hoeflea sp. TYP-13]|uniref:hypothetical protein n=1 Tax=Hoeflea sp. TYP-13 TaxID=3230023 RepID=UPI0034C63613